MRVSDSSGRGSRKFAGGAPGRGPWEQRVVVEKPEDEMLVRAEAEAEKGVGRSTADRERDSALRARVEGGIVLFGGDEGVESGGGEAVVFQAQWRSWGERSSVGRERASERSWAVANDGRHESHGLAGAALPDAVMTT